MGTFDEPCLSPVLFPFSSFNRRVVPCLFERTFFSASNSPKDGREAIERTQLLKSNLVCFCGFLTLLLSFFPLSFIFNPFVSDTSNLCVLYCDQKRSYISPIYKEL